MRAITYLIKFMFTTDVTINGHYHYLEVIWQNIQK